MLILHLGCTSLLSCDAVFVSRLSFGVASRLLYWNNCDAGRITCCLLALPVASFFYKYCDA